MALSAAAPDLVRRVVLVDVLPSVDDAATAVIGAFINGPATFADFDELLAAHHRVQPHPVGVVAAPRHPAQRGAAGRRIVGVAALARARRRAPPAAEHDLEERDRGDVAACSSGWRVPLLLVRGMEPQSVLRDEHEAELRAALPGATVVHVEGAGHSVQGDRPVEFAGLLREFALRGA